MAANEILKFVETDTTTNLLTQAEYSADPQRDIGNQPGIARSKLVNKAMRQASLIAAGIAQYVADKQALDVTDELTPAQFALMMSDAFDAEFVKLTGATMSGALALFGGDTGVTTAQFDNDTSLATTAFVQRALGNLQGSSSYATTQAILPSQVGKLITFGAGGLTLTLPSTSAVPSGSVLQIYGNSFGGVIARASGDILFDGTLGDVASFTIGAYDKVTLVAIGSAGWYVQGGEESLKTSSAMSALLSANGYQKLPSGLIIQWGAVVNTVVAGSSNTLTFPIAFPTQVYLVVITPNVSSAAGYSSTDSAPSLSGISYRSSFGASLNNFFIAIGR